MMAKGLRSNWNKICKCLDYMTVIYFVVMTPGRCSTEPLPAPLNLSYVWNDPFFINATWQAPAFNLSCPLTYVFRGPDQVEITMHTLSTRFPVAELDSSMRFSVRTTTQKTGPCGRYKDSPEVSLAVPLQAPLVTDFTFFLYPACHRKHAQSGYCGMQATWSPANGTAGLRVSYRPCQLSSANMTSCNIIGTGSGGRGQGCHLADMTVKHDACVLFQGTVDGKERNHSFRRNPTKHINSLQPACHITEQAGHLNVSWQHIGGLFRSMWSYKVNYSECNKRKDPVVADLGASHKLLPFNEDCRYEVWVQPVFQWSRTDWGSVSERCVYNATRDRTQGQLAMCAFVAVPGTLSVLVVVACYYIRRKRKTIFKNIPVPPSSLKEMMSSIHQSQHLFVPAPEEVQVCRVSLKPAEEDTPMWKVS